MRDTKFRAFYNGKIWGVWVIDWLNDLVDLSGGLIDISLDEVELMRFAGLKDINGNNIYEGDIVKYIDCWSGEKFINEVYWKFGSLVFDVKYEDERIYTVPIHSIHMDDDRGYEQTLEVIGNIHENKELLEDN